MRELGCEWDFFCFVKPTNLSRMSDEKYLNIALTGDKVFTASPPPPMVSLSVNESFKQRPLEERKGIWKHEAFLVPSRHWWATPVPHPQTLLRLVPPGLKNIKMG